MNAFRQNRKISFVFFTPLLAAACVVVAGLGGCAGSGPEAAQPEEPASKRVAPAAAAARADVADAGGAGVMSGAGAGAGGAVDIRVAAKRASAQSYEMLVESEPSGAQVVIDETPVGKTPCSVLMDGTPAGFCLSAFSVKVRFIARGGGERSLTVEEVFSKHDKVPAKLRFTPEGATRTLRE